MSEINKAPASRPKRVGVGKRNRFEVANKDPNFHYRIVRDEPGRIQEFLDAGYEVCQSTDAKLGAKRLEGGSKVGTNQSIPLGAGSTGFLMKLPMEYRLEDEAKKVQEVLGTEESIKQSAREYQRGQFEKTTTDGILRMPYT